MSDDPISDLFYEMIDEFSRFSEVDWEYVTSSDIEDFLTERGFMVVPIEDPTDMFGIMEDSL